MSELCACGCGGTPRAGKRFIRGHYARTPEAKAGYASRHRPIEPPNPSGLCMCGCGQPTPISKIDRYDRGIKKGYPVCYIRGHGNRGVRGPETSNWKGGRYVHKGGYVYVYAPDHPAANRDGYVYEHRLVVEKKLGRYLEPQERVHHINGIRTDNNPDNLVVLQTNSEHSKLHAAAGLQAYLAEHPESRSEGGKKGAASRWHKDKTDT